MLPHPFSVGVADGNIFIGSLQITHASDFILPEAALNRVVLSCLSPIFNNLVI